MSKILIIEEPVSSPVTDKSDYGKALASNIECGSWDECRGLLELESFKNNDTDGGDE